MSFITIMGCLDCGEELVRHHMETTPPEHLSEMPCPHCTGELAPRHTTPNRRRDALGPIVGPERRGPAEAGR